MKLENKWIEYKEYWSKWRKEWVEFKNIPGAYEVKKLKEFKYRLR